MLLQGLDSCSTMKRTGNGQNFVFCEVVEQEIIKDLMQMLRMEKTNRSAGGYIRLSVSWISVEHGLGQRVDKGTK